MQLAKTGRGVEGMNPRQLCNLIFAVLLDAKDEEGREEFLEELRAPLDPWAQADAVWAKYQMP
jgi:hypothetical protein